MYKILQQQRATQEFFDPQQKVQSDLVLTDEFTLLDKAQTAKVLCVKECTISAWITRKRLIPTRVGARSTISLAELKRFVRESNPEKPVSPSTATDRTHLERLAERIQKSLAKLGTSEHRCLQ